jgi:hypothetical protein
MLPNPRNQAGQHQIHQSTNTYNGLVEQ